jgi:hypothetical protein
VYLACRRLRQSPPLAKYAWLVVAWKTSGRVGESSMRECDKSLPAGKRQPASTCPHRAILHSLRVRIGGTDPLVCLRLHVKFVAFYVVDCVESSRSCHSSVTTEPVYYSQVPLCIHKPPSMKGVSICKAASIHSSDKAITAHHKLSICGRPVLPNSASRALHFFFPTLDAFI